MKSINLNELKNKFGYLLSYLALECGLSADYISARIEQSSYFDFLEHNNPAAFLSKDNQDIAFEIFSARERNISDKYLNDYVFAGVSYISASISLSIPLRKVFLLFPLRKMLSLYPEYHEVNPYRIIKRIKEEIDNVSALGILLKKSSYSVLTLSKITGINRNLLSEIMRDDGNISKLSCEEIYRLRHALNVDEVFFLSSRFVPYYSFLWKDESFIEIMKDKIRLVLSTNKEVIYKDLNQEDIRVNDKGVVILLTPEEAFIYQRGRLREKADSHLFDLAIELAINDIKTICFNNNEAYC